MLNNSIQFITLLVKFALSLCGDTVMSGNHSRTQGHPGIALPSQKTAITEKSEINSYNNQIIHNTMEKKF